MGKIIKAKIIKVIDEYKVVINKGSNDGVTKNDRYLIYKPGDELFDPDTKESLGVLEIVCGEGKPEHIQEKMTTIVSAKTETTKSKTVIKRNAWGAIIGGDVEETYNPETFTLPFEKVDTSCMARQIR